VDEGWLYTCFYPGKIDIDMATFDLVYEMCEKDHWWGFLNNQFLTSVLVCYNINQLLYPHRFVKIIHYLPLDSVRGGKTGLTQRANPLANVKRSKLGWRFQPVNPFWPSRPTHQLNGLKYRPTCPDPLARFKRIK